MEKMKLNFWKTAISAIAIFLMWIILKIELNIETFSACVIGMTVAMGLGMYRDE